MKKSVLFAAILTAFFLIGISGCKKKEPESGSPETQIEYEGTYRANSIQYGDIRLNLGESSSLLGNLTKDMAVLTLSSDGSLHFQCKLIIVSFDVTGEWNVSETDPNSITAKILSSEEDQALIPATCDGETLVIAYRGVNFTLKK